MNAFLHQCMLDKTSNPYMPITLKSATPTFTPEPNPRRDLPREDGHARRDHDEEHHSHPRRDVAEHFARGVIHTSHCIPALARRIDSMKCGTIWYKSPTKA